MRTLIFWEINQRERALFFAEKIEQQIICILVLPPSLGSARIRLFQEKFNFFFKNFAKFPGKNSKFFLSFFSRKFFPKIWTKKFNFLQNISLFSEILPNFQEKFIFRKKVKFSNFQIFKFFEKLQIFVKNCNFFPKFFENFAKFARKIQFFGKIWQNFWKKVGKFQNFWEKFNSLGN